MCQVLRLVLRLLQWTWWHPCSQGPRTSSSAPIHQMLQHSVNSPHIPRAGSSSLPELAWALEEGSGLQCVPTCVPQWFVPPHWGMPGRWMLTSSFGDASLTVTILLKVSLCDSMKSITQIFNFVDTYWAQEMSGIDLFSARAWQAPASLKVVSVREAEAKGVQSGCKQEKAQHLFSFSLHKHTFDRNCPFFCLQRTTRSLSLIKMQRLPRSY